MSASSTLAKSALPIESRVSLSVYVQLSLAVLIWAANWAMTKSVLHDISPVSFVAYRFLTAAPFMAVLTLPIRQSLLPVRGERLPLALIGIVQIAGSQFFSTVGLQYVAAGRTVVLLYYHAALGLAAGMADQSRTRQFAGLVRRSGWLPGPVPFFNNPPVNWSDSPGRARQLPLPRRWFILGARGLPLPPRKWQTPFWTQTFWQVLWTAIVARAPALWTATRNSLDRTRHCHDCLQRHRLHGAGLVVVGQGAVGDAGLARRTNRHSGSGACCYHWRPLGARGYLGRHRGERYTHLPGSCFRTPQ